jgi:hypothetical protein
MIVAAARGPREMRWVGWRGGWAIRRDDLPKEPVASNTKVKVLKQEDKSEKEKEESV